MTWSPDERRHICILSVGGSLVAPLEGIDVAFLEDLKKLVFKHVASGMKFVIVVGGGRTARNYQEAAKKIGNLTRDDLDWLGIHATRLNGHLLRTVFRRHAHPVMFTDPRLVPEDGWDGEVLIAAGWRPGWSTDYVATLIAKRLHVPLVINLSNTEGLFSKDPNKFKDAKQVPLIEWKEFRAMFGTRWDPGMSAPFDPVASKLAQKEEIGVALVDGKDLKNLDRLIGGKKWRGTLVG